MAQLMIAMAAVSAVSSIAGGMQKQASAKKEAQSLENQAVLTQQEAEIEAKIHATQVRKFAANQKSAFLKNGVTLDGSPLLVLDDTYSSGQEEVNAIVRSGSARAQLLREKADQTRSEGRSQLIGGISSAASSGAAYGFAGSSAGFWGNGMNTGTGASGISPSTNYFNVVRGS